MRFFLEPLSERHFDSLVSLFSRTIEDTCRRNEIYDASVEESEVREKIEKASRILESDVQDEYIVCACLDNRVVAVGGYFHCGNDIKDNYSSATDKDFEIGSIYVDPRFQRLGLGNRIFEHLKEALKHAGVSRAFIDSGYTTSQCYWEEKLGEPRLVAKSSFGPEFRYMIWELEF